MDVTRAPQDACGAVCSPRKPDPRFSGVTACTGDGAQLAPSGAASRVVGGTFISSTAFLLLPEGRGAAGAGPCPRRKPSGRRNWGCRTVCGGVERCNAPPLRFLPVSGGLLQLGLSDRGAAVLKQLRRTCSARRGDLVCHGDDLKTGPRMPGGWGRTSLLDLGGRFGPSPSFLKRGVAWT